MSWACVRPHANRQLGTPQAQWSIYTGLHSQAISFCSATHLQCEAGISNDSCSQGKRYQGHLLCAIHEASITRIPAKCLPGASFSTSSRAFTPLYMSWTHCTSERPRRRLLLMSYTPASSPVDSLCSPWMPRGWIWYLSQIAVKLG